MDPRSLAQRQLELDRVRLAQYPELSPRKLGRLLRSPLGFLRGAAPLFYEILKHDPDLAAGPLGEGVIQGDAHLENFGAFSPAVEHEGTFKKGPALFQLNDFDEATHGAWRWDALRLTTSLLLGGRELGVSGPEALELGQALLERHSAALFTDAAAPPEPAPVSRLIERVEQRSTKKLLEERTKGEGSERRFVRGDRYVDIAEPIARQVPQALALFAQRAAAAGGPKPEQLELIDVAFRIAGTGSLGALRLAALTRGKGGDDGAFLFDLKAQLGSSVDVLASPPASSSWGAATASRAAQVEAAIRLCLPAPPRMLGTTRLGPHDLLVRRLTPQEDKLDLAKLEASALPGLVRYLGWLLGSAHRRAGAATTAWSAGDRAAVLERAVKLAGLHEAIYSEFCWLTRGNAPTDAGD